MGPGIKKLGLVRQVSKPKKPGLVRHLSKPRNEGWFGGGLGGLYHVKSGLVRRVLT